jgi:hypothetical protein
MMNTVAFLSVALLTSAMGKVIGGVSPAGLQVWRNVLFLPFAVAAAGLAGALLAPETFGRVPDIPGTKKT